MKINKRKMFTPHSAWEVLYDFLNEIFATIIPGAFFLSYFFCVIFIAARDLSIINDFAANMSAVLTLVIASAAYCFGALFHRREIKNVDTKSARHTYRKMPHNSGHSFAFANALTNEYVIRLIRIIQFHMIRDAEKFSVDKPYLTRCRDFFDNTRDAWKTPGDQSCQPIRPDEKRRQDPPNETVEPFLCLMAGMIKTRVDETCSNSDCDKLLPVEDYLSILARMLLLNESSNVHLHYYNDTVNKQLKDINAHLIDNGYPGLKQLIEECMWKTIAERFDTMLTPRQEETRGLIPELLRALNLERKRTILPEFKKSPLCPILSPIDVKWLLNPPSSDNEKHNNRLVWSIHEAIAKMDQEQNQKGEQNDAKNYYNSHSFLGCIKSYIHADLKGSIDWPYTHMRRYCQDRGLEYATQVTWGDGAIHEGILDDIGLTTDPSLSEEINRSKSRINTDKMDIADRDPVLYRAINKNEAHIRFMNCVWYASDILLKVAIVLGLLALIDYTYSHLLIQWIAMTESRYVYIIIASLAFIIVCFYIKRSVLEIMHYQRVRELNMLLKAKAIVGEKAKIKRDRQQERLKRANPLP